MAMALLEEEEDEGWYDEMLLAAVDAAVSRRFARPVQQQHPAPSLGFVAPQKKVMITHVSSGSHHHESDLKPPAGLIKEVLLAKTASDPCVQTFHRDMRVPSGGKDLKPQPVLARNAGAAGGAGNDVKAHGILKTGATVWNGGGGSNDVKPNGYLKTTGAVWSGGSDPRQDALVNNNGGAGAAWNGRLPLQELQPWVERPSSTVWLQETKERKGLWSSGSSGVALFKDCQDAAMRTLVPSDYTMMQGKPFIKKAGWRKIAAFFDVSFEIKEKNIQFDPHLNVQRAEFVVRASMPSGRFTDSWGSCDRGEKRFSKPNHDIPSTAETRAKTRACQDLLGIGEYKSDTASY